ncbi:MAG: hypothetical protein R3C11_15885 [Planctomycetaceae bacterium]
MQNWSTLLRMIPSPVCAPLLPSAAKGDPIKVIPILLHIHETDKEYEEELEFDAVSEYAAFALDEILKTNWINVDLGNGLFMMRPGGRDYISLVQHAKSYLERLKREQGSDT